MEAVVYDLAEGLVAKGHEVTLIASKGSRAPEGAELITTIDPSFTANEGEAYNLYKNRLSDFVIIHDHSWQKFSYLYKMEHPELKLISTTHSPCPYRTPPPVQYPNFCGVSNAHSLYMSNLLGIPVRTVNNGIPPSRFKFQKEKGERLLFLNRIMPEKGPHIAIDIANRARVPLDVCGEDVVGIPSQEYVHRIMGRCDGKLIRYYGRISHEKKVELLANAKAVLACPLPPWMEVFGLYAVEANLSGTPVIALRNGGLTEIIEDGINGFLCNTPEDMMEAIKRVDEIQPEACRARGEEFSAERMSKEYECLYNKIVNEHEEW